MGKLSEHLMLIGDKQPRVWAIERALQIAGYNLKNDRIVGAEVGVWRGQVSAALLSDIQKLRLYMVDWWRQAKKGSNAWEANEPGARDAADIQDQRYQTALRQTDGPSLRARRMILRMDSKEAAALFPNEWLDFVFIDAGHTYSDVLGDLRAWAPKVKRCGVIGGHDIDHPIREPGMEQWDVRRALTDFALSLSFTPEVMLGPDTTWFFLR